MTAKIGVKYKFILRTIHSLAILNKNKSIKISQLNGPFKHFEFNWQFQEMENNTLVNVVFELEFHDKFSGVIAKKEIKKIMPRVTNALLQRAKQLKNQEQ